MYTNAYLMTLPSDIEGMSLSLLEALAYGNALLCSDIPENKLVAEEKAMYFKKGDVSDLTRKLQTLCDNPDMIQELKSGADDFILNKYSWNDVSDSTYKLYQKIIEK